MRVLNGLDYAVLAAYAAVVLVVGVWAGRREKDTEDYFLGGRRQSWIVAMLSLLATEVSALTFVSVPGQSFGGNCSYLQLYVGAFLAKVVIAAVLLPAFYGGRVTTVYEYLGQRFGGATRTTATLFFFASRLLGSGYRLLACCVALAVVVGWPLEWVTVGIVAVVLAYTTFGGIKAVMFTDTVQAMLIIGGPIACIAVLVHHIGLPAGDLLHAAADAGKLHVFNFSWSVTDASAFYLIATYAFFQTLAAMGTDQDLTQRMLTCPDVRRARWSMIGNAIVGLPVVCVFLTLGVLLYLYYQHTPDPTLPAANDKVFAHFIVTGLPAGLRGLLIAALLAASMGSLDSALQSLSTSAVVDLVRPFRRRPAADKHDLRLARVFVVFFAAVLCALTLYVGRAESFQKLVYKALEMTSIVLGPMLGVFLLAVTTRTRGRDVTNAIAMGVAVALVVVIKWFAPASIWPWYIIIGTTVTFALACAFPTRRGYPDAA